MLMSSELYQKQEESYKKTGRQVDIGMNVYEKSQNACGFEF